MTAELDRIAEQIADDLPKPLRIGAMAPGPQRVQLQPDAQAAR